MRRVVGERTRPSVEAGLSERRIEAAPRGVDGRRTRPPPEPSVEGVPRRAKVRLSDPGAEHIANPLPRCESFLALEEEEGHPDVSSGEGYTLAVHVAFFGPAT